MGNVELLEEETFATGSQVNAPWHLDMLDQTSDTLDERYDPIGDGDGVDIYILDSGKKLIQQSLSKFSFTASRSLV